MLLQFGFHLRHVSCLGVQNRIHFTLSRYFQSLEGYLRLKFDNFRSLKGHDEHFFSMRWIKLSPHLVGIVPLLYSQGEHV